MNIDRPLLKMKKLRLLCGGLAVLCGNAFASRWEGGIQLRGSPDIGIERRLQDMSAADVALFTTCTDALLSPEAIADGKISQNEFCEQLPLFTCTAQGFTALPEELQLVFVQKVCPEDEGTERQMACLQEVRSLEAVGEWGYIVPADGTNDPEVEMLVDTICSGIIPLLSEEEEVVPPAAEGETEPATMPPLIDAATEAGPELQGEQTPLAPGGVLDLDGGSADEASRFIPYAAKSGGLNLGPLIGLATAGTACLILLLLFVKRSRRSDTQKVMGDPATDDGFGPAKAGNTLVNTSTSSASSTAPLANNKPNSFSVGSWSEASTHDVSIGQMKQAIDDANWDEIYQLASRLAEQDDSSTLPSMMMSSVVRTSSYNEMARVHLSKENQERTKSLDELVDCRDWTGIAVAAALYAGEAVTTSSQCSTPPSAKKHKKRADKSRPTTRKVESNPAESEDLKERVDSAVKTGSWNQILTLTSGTDKKKTDESTGDQGEVPDMQSLESDLFTALSNGKWAKVGELADQMKKVASTSGGSVVSSSLSPSLQSMLSTDTNDSDFSKKQTIEKLIRAQKWKGVSIMAGLYNVESDGTKDEPSQEMVRSARPPQQSSWAGVLPSTQGKKKSKKNSSSQQADFEEIELNGDIEDARK